MFMALPVLSIVGLLAAVITHGGPLFALGRAGIVGFLTWCLWACAVTPAATRIPLWSVAALAGLFLIIFANGTVPLVFATKLIKILLVNVIVATLPRADTCN